ncbi:MAG: DUF169 domain-containing protein [Candidatus Baldrarchaeia archaeon]
MDIDEWRSVGSDLMDILRLETYPVAVKLVKSDEELPSNVRRPSKIFGFKINLCQAFSMSRRYGRRTIV